MDNLREAINQVEVATRCRRFYKGKVRNLCIYSGPNWTIRLAEDVGELVHLYSEQSKELSVEEIQLVKGELT